MSTPDLREQAPDDKLVRLHDALADDQLQRYLEGTGPLGISELPEEVRLSEGFQDFVSFYDWPSSINAGTIKPVQEYQDAADFWYNIYEPTSSEKGLNNFKEWLRYRPVAQFDPRASIAEQVYATKPALQRAYVVAEPLFTALREVVDIDDNPEEVIEDYPEVAEGAYAAYRLLGRLLTKDDLRLQMSLLTDTSALELHDVEDAHVALIE